jgi:transcriptional regulator with XRE-family HTH domain
MDNKLAENIRTFRKQRSLTQEQLSEVLGVTVGAVHKWETRLSTPDLGLIMEMADFFNVSVDTLLGYEMKDNGLDATIKRLQECMSSIDPNGLIESEKALKRFPHVLDIVYLSAFNYLVTGSVQHDMAMLDRSKELFYETLRLFPQSSSLYISELNVYHLLSCVLVSQGKSDEAADLLMKHNPNGIFNHSIGLYLAGYSKRTSEAVPYLNYALIGNFTNLLQAIEGSSIAFTHKGNFESAEGILLWGINMINEFKIPETVGYLDRLCAQIHILLTHVYLKSGKPRKVIHSLKTAIEMAKTFDLNPNYTKGAMRYLPMEDNNSFYFDIMGRTAMESLDYTVQIINDKELSKLWKEYNPYE